MENAIIFSPKKDDLIFFLKMEDDLKFKKLQNILKFFKKYISAETSSHSESYKILENRLSSTDSTSSFTLPPTVVLQKVIHALESKNPKIRYHVTFPTHIFAILKRILPDRWLDRLLLIASEGGKR